MKNSADLRECYPPRPKAEVDNTLLDLQNSSYPTQPHSIIAKYISQNLKDFDNFFSSDEFRIILGLIQTRSLSFEAVNPGSMLRIIPNQSNLTS